MTERENEQLQKIREKMAQMKAQQQTIIAKDKKRQRKERTRRLIQIGALAEKYFECKDIEPAEFEKLVKGIVSKLKD